jgi:hypothetical protein
MISTHTSCNQLWIIFLEIHKMNSNGMGFEFKVFFFGERLVDKENETSIH